MDNTKSPLKGPLEKAKKNLSQGMPNMAMPTRNLPGKPMTDQLPGKLSTTIKPTASIMAGLVKKVKTAKQKAPSEKEPDLPMFKKGFDWSKND